MANVFDSTGKATANGSFRITRAFGSLLFRTNLTYEALANEVLKISIQRKVKDNVELIKGKGILLKRLLQLAGSGQAVICTNPAGLTEVVINLTKLGNIPLEAGDEILVEYSSFDSTKTYMFNTIEDPFQANTLYVFESKTAIATDKQPEFGVSGCDLVLLDRTSEVVDIRPTWSDGTVTTHLLEEIDAASRQADPLVYLNATGNAKTGFGDVVVMAVAGINSIQVNKSDAANFTVYTRSILK